VILIVCFEQYIYLPIVPILSHIPSSRVLVHPQILVHSGGAQKFL
jgi:hypothetical protein